ncbi:MAG: PA0069 family radical SAM protein [bacterium]|nr:PA0069 family radical SAM protein [bacterium]
MIEFERSESAGDRPGRSKEYIADSTALPPQRGRGAGGNPANRFDRIHVEPWRDDGEESATPGTAYLRDVSRSIIAYNTSPDILFDASINPYRGCEHGCPYCYARPSHEYFGLGSGIDFESKIFVKENAPELLRRELRSRSWKPQPLALSGVTDCYQPVERSMQLTRRCLKVLLEHRNPCYIVTKNHLITRDVDLLKQMAAYDGVSVFISLSTLSDELSGALEPRASRPRRRLEAIRTLREAGTPVGVLCAPIVPGLNDQEIPAILAEAAKAGAAFTRYILLRLPYAVKDVFVRFLEKRFPTRKDKILHHVQDVRGGALNVSQFGERFRGHGAYAKQIENLFHVSAKKYGLLGDPAVSADHFRREGALAAQQMLW